MGSPGPLTTQRQDGMADGASPPWTGTGPTDACTVAVGLSIPFPWVGRTSLSRACLGMTATANLLFSLSLVLQFQPKAQARADVT